MRLASVPGLTPTQRTHNGTVQGVSVEKSPSQLWSNPWPTALAIMPCSREAAASSLTSEERSRTMTSLPS